VQERVSSDLAERVAKLVVLGHSIADKGFETLMKEVLKRAGKAWNPIVWIASGGLASASTYAVGKALINSLDSRDIGGFKDSLDLFETFRNFYKPPKANNGDSED
jgi:hypothetical protein